VIRTYRALLIATIQAAAQYRVQSVLWMLFSVIRPVIFLAAWVAVANAQGGRVGAYEVRDFAAYYIALSLVSQLTMAWDAYEFEFEVRMGRLAPKLLRPLHPIHYAVAWNIIWKLTTILPLLVVLTLVSVSFDVRFRTTPAHVALFVPSVLLAAALSFVSGWVLASVAFWTTRVHAVSSLWTAVRSSSRARSPRSRSCRARFRSSPSPFPSATCSACRPRSCAEVSTSRLH